MMYMKCKEVKYYLGDFLDGKLIDEIRREIDVHISFCHSCKTKLEELEKASRSSRQKFAGDFWEGSSDLNEYDSDLKLPDILFSRFRGRDDPVYKLKPRNSFLHSKWIAIGAPVLSIMLAIFIAILYFSRMPTTFWQVDKIKGNPVIENQSINDGGALPNGKWLKTDAVSEALLKSGIIGDIYIAPQSEIKLAAFNKKEYRLYIKTGKISAKTWSPPHFFKIEIPSGEVIDLGCAFSLEVNNDNTSELQVFSGWIGLKTGNEKIIIPAGMSCRTHEDGRIIIPYNINTSVEFKNALEMYEDNNKSTVLQNILTNAGKIDEVSLWYLLEEANPPDKRLIYDKLAEYVLPPENVNYNGILNGDNTMMLSWWEKLGCGSKALWNSLR